MPYLAAEDATIFFETTGDHGPWLTLINGHTRSSRDFRLLATKLSKEGLRCLLFDNRGSGETKSSSPFKLIDIAEDAIKLWDHLQIKDSVICGLSMGGIICQMLAYHHPKRVTGLILVATGSSEQSLASEAFTPWGNSPESVEEKLKNYFSAAFWQRNHLLVRAMSKQILQDILSQKFEGCAQAQRHAMSGADTRNLLPSINQRTLILHGTEDRIIPVSAGEEIAHLLPHATLKALPGIGHLVLAESSKVLYDEILLFIRSSAPAIEP